MRGAFISYSRENSDFANRLAEAISQKNIKVWRDQNNIYASQQWPKIIGEAIAAQDVLLLLWSKAAASSHFVEFEWNTALALKKPIIPVLVDDTPLPPMLTAMQGVILKDFEDVINRIVQSVKFPYSAENSQQQNKVIEKLEEIDATSPDTVLESAKNIYRQQGWVVQGNIYQVSGRDINISIQEATGTKENPKEWWEKWQARVAFVIIILTLLTTLLDLPKKVKEAWQEVFDKPVVTSSLKGIVVNRDGMPVGGAVVKLDVLPGDSARTTSDGSFKFSEVPGEVGDDVRVYVSASNYQRRNEFVTLPGPVELVLERK
ncbi:MAG: TIR domain-containing protein [Calditrichia bacterium]